jgi:hypothetical protein
MVHLGPCIGRRSHSPDNCGSLRKLSRMIGEVSDGHSYLRPDRQKSELDSRNAIEIQLRYCVMLGLVSSVSQEREATRRLQR